MQLKAIFVAEKLLLFHIKIYQNLLKFLSVMVVYTVGHFFRQCRINSLASRYAS